MIAELEKSRDRRIKRTNVVYPRHFCENVTTFFLVNYSIHYKQQIQRACLHSERDIKWIDTVDRVEFRVGVSVEQPGIIQG